MRKLMSRIESPKNLRNATSGCCGRKALMIPSLPTTCGLTPRYWRRWERRWRALPLIIVVVAAKLSGRQHQGAAEESVIGVLSDRAIIRMGHGHQPVPSVPGQRQRSGPGAFGIRRNEKGVACTRVDTGGTSMTLSMRLNDSLIEPMCWIDFPHFVSELICVM